MKEAAVKVGDRIEYKKARGYVRYIGQLPGKDKLWVGIDWDDANRGLHDGSYKDISYFSAHSATSGSFVSASKLGQGGRRSIVDAIKLRVQAFDDSVSRPKEPQELRTKSAIDVSSLGVASPVSFSETEIGIVCKSIVNFWIAQALLSDFKDVHFLLDQLVSLRTLDVSRNFFASFPHSQTPLRPTNLQRLDMNGCNVKIRALYDVCGRCPELRELRLYNNGINSLILEDLKFSDVIQTVKTIDLGGNNIPFREICEVLGTLPKLEELFLIENNVDGSQGVETDGLFPVLHRLCVSDNPLRNWELITSLLRIPSLTSLMATDTPLTVDERRLDEIALDDDALFSRHGIIGRLPKLKKLHGSEIDDDERMYSEKRYLLIECMPALKGGLTLEDVEKLHPRIVELADMYGVQLKTKLGNSANGASSKQILENTLRRDLISIDIEGNGIKLTKMLPLSIDTSKLRAMTRRMLGVTSGEHFQLSLDCEDTTIVLDNSCFRKRSLADLNVKRDDKVIIKLVRESSRPQDR